jgi:nitroreductase
VEAPILICACGIPSQSWLRKDGKNYCDIDVTIAMDHLILAATELGLGTCWVGAFNPEEARKVLQLPDDIEPIVFTPLGYPNDHSGDTTRKPVEELVRYDFFFNS